MEDLLLGGHLLEGKELELLLRIRKVVDKAPLLAKITTDSGTHPKEKKRKERQGPKEGQH